MSLTHSQRSRLGAHAIASMVLAMGSNQLASMATVNSREDTPHFVPMIARTGGGNLGRPPWVVGNPGTRQRKRRKYAASRRG